LPVAAQRLLFLFHGDGDGADRGEADLVALHARDEAAINEVVMTLVASLAAVFFRQLDPIALDLINRTDMDTVRTDDFHVFLDLSHCKFLPRSSWFEATPDKCGSSIIDSRGVAGKHALGPDPRVDNGSPKEVLVQPEPVRLHDDLWRAACEFLPMAIMASYRMDKRSDGANIVARGRFSRGRKLW
jgi:hypothetical protein